MRKSSIWSYTNNTQKSNSVPSLVLETALSPGVSTPKGLEAAAPVLTESYKNFTLFEMQE